MKCSEMFKVLDIVSEPNPSFLLICLVCSLPKPLRPSQNNWMCNDNELHTIVSAGAS